MCTYVGVCQRFIRSHLPENDFHNNTSSATDSNVATINRCDSRSPRTTPSRQALDENRRDISQNLKNTLLQQDRNCATMCPANNAASTSAKRAQYQVNSSSRDDVSASSSTYERLLQGRVRPPQSDVNWFRNGSVNTFTTNNTHYLE